MTNIRRACEKIFCIDNNDFEVNVELDFLLNDVEFRLKFIELNGLIVIFSYCMLR